MQGRVSFAHDLQHLDQIGIEERAELRNWLKPKAHLPRTVLFFLLLLLVPVAILIIMVLAHSK